ncbi:unnamed protein product [Adineta steineri]|uniref:Uncharacterized protein n=1 Tax=Adineta steineri TaxID=433720 RepID=A0A815SK37_9BILA|nr:unnamed protein product [Adineta steineri]
MPSWKINCLKSEEHTNPSVLSSNTINESNKIDSIPQVIDHEQTDIPETVASIDIHSLPSSPSIINCHEQKQRNHHHHHHYSPTSKKINKTMSWRHRLATLEPSPSFVAVTPIKTPTTNNHSRSSPFEQRLARYRSLPLLWFRTCGSSNHQHRRRTAAGIDGKDTIYTPRGHFGEFEYKHGLVYIVFSFHSPP